MHLLYSHSQGNLNNMSKIIPLDLYWKPILKQRTYRGNVNCSCTTPDLAYKDVVRVITARRGLHCVEPDCKWWHVACSALFMSSYVYEFSSQSHDTWVAVIGLINLSAWLIRGGGQSHFALIRSEMCKHLWWQACLERNIMVQYSPTW